MRNRKIILLLPVFILLFGCPSDDDMVTSEETQLKNVTAEVILFEYTPDTGNNTSRLHYEIKFSNPNSTTVNGFPKITMNADGIITTNIATDPSTCSVIGANSDCTISFNGEDSHNLVKINSIKLVSVEYNFKN